jgi:WD40 repeat protein
MARLWKANDGTAVGQPMMHGARVEGACFSSDGKRILTWSLDGTARLWCAGNNQCIAVFKHTGSMNSAWFNRAETRLLTVGSKTAQLWDISLDENIPIEERILEFEVRSATTIGSDGDVKVLSVSEWEKKKAKLLDDEIRLAKAIVLPGDARSLTSSELSSKQHELTELRRRLSK